MVIISPVNTTTKPAPAAIRQFLMVISKPSGVPKASGHPRRNTVFWPCRQANAHSPFFQSPSKHCLLLWCSLRPLHRKSFWQWFQFFLSAQFFAVQKFKVGFAACCQRHNFFRQFNAAFAAFGKYFRKRQRLRRVRRSGCGWLPVLPGYPVQRR